MQIFSNEWLFKNSDECRHFRIVEPTGKNNITLRFVYKDISCTYSLNENSLKTAIDLVLKRLSEKGLLGNKDTSLANKLHKILSKDYEELKQKIGSDYSKYNSLSGLFYKNNKLISFHMRDTKNENYSTMMVFHKVGYKSASRSIEEHGFSQAFDQIFSFGCKQMGLNPKSPSIMLFKSTVKSDLKQKHSDKN